MRIVMIDRHLLGSEGLPLPEGRAFDVSKVRRIFDERRLPDGFPFVVDDDGGVSGCRHLNQYLLDAHEQNAFDLGNMRRVRVEPTRADAERLLKSGPIDVLITHDAPAGVDVESKFDLPPEVAKKADRTRALLREVIDLATPAHVFCGHWHQRRIQGLSHQDGSFTRVDVLDKEYSRDGNAVLVWPGKPPLLIEPLPVRGI